MDMSARRENSSRDVERMSVKRYDNIINGLSSIIKDEKSFSGLRHDHDGSRLSSIQKHMIENMKNDLVYNHTLMSFPKNEAVYRSTLNLMNSIISGSRDMSHQVLELRDALAATGVTAPRSTNLEAALMSLSIAVSKMKSMYIADMSPSAAGNTGRASAPVSSVLGGTTKEPPKRKEMAFGGLGLEDLVKGLKPGSINQVADDLKKALEAEKLARQALNGGIARREPPQDAYELRKRTGVAGAYEMGSKVQYLNAYRDREGSLDRKF